MAPTYAIPSLFYEHQLFQYECINRIPPDVEIDNLKTFLFISFTVVLRRKTGISV